MHFDVVAGDFAGNSDRQLQAVAAACMAELLGEAAPTHEIRWQLQADGKHLLIGAIARDQLGALSEAAARHGLTLASVQPDFCLQWNRHAPALKPGAAVFAVAAGHEAVIACVADGAVAAMSSGAWLARVHRPGNSTVTVNQLMHGLGLEPAAKEVLLDMRVDRLLASVGQDAASQSAFVLVAPEMAGAKVSSRWTLINRDAQHHMRTQRLQLEFAPNPRRVSRIGVLMLFVAGSVLVAGALELSNVLAANARLADTLAAVDARRGAVAASRSQDDGARPERSRAHARRAAGEPEPDDALGRSARVAGVGAGADGRGALDRAIGLQAHHPHHGRGAHCA